MADSTDKKIASLFNSPDYPNLAEKATDLAKRRGFDSLATLLRTLLISELQKSEDINQVSKAGQRPDDGAPTPSTGTLEEALP